MDTRDHTFILLWQRIRLAFAILSLLISSLSYASYEITDSFGKHRFDAPPKRVVVTDWTLLEQLLDLGIQPIGAPEIDRFRHYVGHPTLPEDIVDIGLRQSPSLSTLKQLSPDVIILGTNQKTFARPFSKIAYVLYYQSFSERYRTNGKKSLVRFLQLAEVFQKKAWAKEKMAKQDARIAELKLKLKQHFKGAPPNIFLLRFSNDRKALVYGHNSMPHHALTLLGLKTPIEVNRNRWGEQEISINKLREFNQGYLLYFTPVDKREVFQSEEWRKLPLVKNDHLLEAGKVWSYGGAMSIGRIAESISNALINNTRE